MEPSQIYKIKMIVYKTTNLINGKVYIGKDRKNDPSYLGSGKLLQKAIKKYGKESFLKKILFESDNEDDINKKEIEMINFYKNEPNENCYNLAEGGTGGYTLKHSSIFAYNKWKSNLSNANKGRIVSNETRKKLSKANGGRFHGNKKQISMSLKKVWGDPNSVFNSNEYRQKLSDSLKGKPCKEETKNKISVANSGSNNGRAISFEIDGVVFDTRRSVAKYYNISETAVSKRCKSKNFPKWRQL